MATAANIALGKKVAAYAAFCLASFGIGIYLTFPYDIVRQRITAEASAGGAYVKVASLGPGLFGITATGVELSRKMEANEDKAPTPLKVDSIAVRPSLFPLGVAVRAKLLQGTAHLGLGLVGDLKVRVNLDGLDLQSENLKAFSGLALGGKASAQLALDIPKVSPSKTAPAEPELAQANGSASLDVADLQVNGGTVTVPMYGQPTPMDLPKVAVGDLDAKIKFEKGLGTLDAFHAKSNELELLISGTLKLAKRFDYSELALLLKLKAQPELTKRLGMIAAGLSMLEADKDNPDFRVAHVTGFLGRPNFSPR